MKLRDLLVNPLSESQSKLTTCQYLDSIGIEYKKTKTNDGAIFELIKSTNDETRAIVDELNSVPELIENFSISWDGKRFIRVIFI